MEFRDAFPLLTVVFNTSGKTKDDFFSTDNLWYANFDVLLEDFTDFVRKTLVLAMNTE